MPIAESNLKANAGVLSLVLTSAAKPWQILSGFAVSGLLLALPGALLPLWDFHIRSDFAGAGNLFFAIGVGAVLGNVCGRELDARFSSAKVLLLGCVLAALSLIWISLGVQGGAGWLRAGAVFSAGFSAGLLNTAILEAITPWYERDPAGTTLIAGSFFGAGSFLAALLISQVLNAASAARWISLAVVVPVAAGIAFSRASVVRSGTRERSRLHALEELRSPLAIFFTLLLFFQFGSEWALAGWLPIYLIDRLGFSPATGVRLLAFYWFALTCGRFAASKLLTRIHHGRLLAFSAFCALFGCVVLLTATNLFGVLAALLLTGAGFSAIYPLAAERIGERFSYYHPAYFNGVFSFALLGAMVAPWTIGHLAASATLQILPVAVMFSSCAVFGITLLIWLGSKVSGG